MTFPDSVEQSFLRARTAIQKSSWFNKNWSCCSGLWSPERYGDTVLIRTAKRNWSSVNPITLTEGGEIQYAAWVDQKGLRTSTVRFEMHVFSFLTPRRIKKGDFTLPFRTANESTIAGFGFHDTVRGPAVPYAGAYQYKDLQDLTDFLIRDFANFASLSTSIDSHLADVLQNQ